MPESFFVDIWSDVVCPFCYLGARQFAGALAGFEHRDDVVVRHRAFELDPGSASSSDLPLDELLAKKYAIGVDHARAINERLQDQARSLGMAWALERARPTNTFDAHRLMALAGDQGRGGEMGERLFRAYFSEGALLSDLQTLSALSDEVGVEGADQLWRSDAYADQVRGDELSAHELGITGVPSMLVDGRFMIVGAQGAEKILDVLRRAWARRGAA